MDDITGKINDILNDKESMEQIMQIAQSLGLSGNQPKQESTAQTSSGEENKNDMSSILANVMGAMGNNKESNDSQSESTGLDIGMLLKIQQAMSTYNQNNKNVELLKALKPHFGDERQKKVDDAIKLMQLTNMLPLLKQTGLFSFLGGEEEAKT